MGNLSEKAESQRTTRREFMKKTAQLGVITGLALGFPQATRRLWAQPRSEIADVAVVHGDPRKSVKAAVDALGGIGNFIRKGQRVVIKPNASFPNPPEWGTTTNPEVIRALANLCREAGASRILVVDHPLRRPDLCFRRSGIRAAVQGISGAHVFPAADRVFYEEVTIPEGQALRRVGVVKEVLESDVLINVPAAKSHNAAGVSLGMKNLMGLIWDRDAFHEKYDLHQAIVDLNKLLRPKLTIIDATRALITSGPSGPGKILNLNTIVAGVDPVAVDSYGVSMAPWYGRSFKGRHVRHLLLAGWQTMGELDLNRVSIRKIKV